LNIARNACSSSREQEDDAWESLAQDEAGWRYEAFITRLFVLDGFLRILPIATVGGPK